MEFFPDSEETCPPQKKKKIEIKSNHTEKNIP